MGRKKSIGTRLLQGYLLLRGYLPLRYHRWWARRIAWILRNIVRYRTDVVYTNLARSFPEKSYEEIKALHRQFYIRFSTIFCEMVWFGACRGPKGRKRLQESHIVEITNPEEFNRIYRDASQLMLLEAHNGNWELIMGLTEYSCGVPMDITPADYAVTYKPLSSKTWDAIMAENRTAAVRDLGFKGYVSSDNILRFVLENRERKFAYIFITDQFPYTSNSSEVSFMGQKTLTLTAAARLAVKFDMAVAYLRYECREEGGYRITAVPVEEHAAGKDPMEIMKKYYALLEEDIRKQPYNYLWTHKRWK